jgi:hypothetical protein
MISIAEGSGEREQAAPCSSCFHVIRSEARETAVAPAQIFPTGNKKARQKAGRERAFLCAAKGGAGADQTASCGREASGQSTWKNFPRGWSTRS